MVWKTMDRRSFVTTTLGLLVGQAAAAKAANVTVSAAPRVKPKNFVLVHGAWYGGWCWDKVAQNLRAQGHTVSTPTCPGMGEHAHMLSKDISLSTFITSISNHIAYQNMDDVVLVGSGFGGVVISGVADHIPFMLKHLVYVDAMVLESGMSVFEGQPAAVTQKRLQQVAAQGKGIAIPAPAVNADSYRGVDKKTLGWLAQRLTPQPVGTYQEKLVLNNALGNGVPRTYVDCTASPFAPLVEVKQKLKRQGGWNWAELATHHDPMITEPQMLSDFLARV